MIRAIRFWVWAIGVCCAFVGTPAVAYVPGFFDGGILFEFTAYSEEEMSEAQKEQMLHAVSVCTERIDGGDDNPLWYFFRGRYNFRFKKAENVITDCKYLIEKYPEFLPPQYLQAQTKLSTSNYNEAIVGFSNLIDNGYENLNVYVNLAYAYWHSGDEIEALKCIEVVSSSGKSLNAIGYWIRGGATVVTNYPNESPDALLDFGRALELNPNAHYVYMSRGKYYLNLRKHNKAISDLSVPIDKGSRNTDFWRWRAFSFVELGEFEKALIDLDYVIEHNLQDDWAFYKRGAAYYALGNLELAEDDLSKAIKLDPNDPDYYEVRGDVRMDLNNFGGALQDYNKWIELDEGLPGVASIFSGFFMTVFLMFVLVCLVVPTVMGYEFFRKKKSGHPPALPSD